MITGGREADQVAADLKARNARVIYSLNYPVRSRALPPDADEPVSALRTRAQAPRVPAALAKAGITFAFSSDGLREPNDFVRNVARAVRDGLAPDAALRALTIDAAKIAGVSDRLGSLEPGKIANVVVTNGDLFEEKTKITHVFVAGRMVTLDDTPQTERTRPVRAIGGTSRSAAQATTSRRLVCARRSAPEARRTLRKAAILLASSSGQPCDQVGPNSRTPRTTSGACRPAWSCRTC